MKNLLFIFFIFTSFNLNAQKVVRVEDLIEKDSVFKFRYKTLIEGCIKIQPRYVNEYKQNCPVFLNKQGILFYIRIINKRLECVELDTNISID